MYLHNEAFWALRAHLLFQLLTVALSVSIISLYNIKQTDKHTDRQTSKVYIYIYIDVTREGLEQND